VVPGGRLHNPFHNLLQHRRPAPRRRLYLHFDLADLDEDLAVGAVERLGPATMQKIRDWVGDSRSTIWPVLWMNREDAVDTHDLPACLRELGILRDRHCVFPWCQRDARSCDMDRIDPYDEHGSPGQTRQPRAPVPTPPPRQDRWPLALPTTTRRELRMVCSGRSDIPRHPHRHPEHPHQPTSDPSARHRRGSRCSQRSRGVVVDVLLARVMIGRRKSSAAMRRRQPVQVTSGICSASAGASTEFRSRA